MNYTAIIPRQKKAPTTRPGVKASHYTHLPPLYPIVLSDEHRERADELGEAGV